MPGAPAPRRPRRIRRQLTVSERLLETIWGVLIVLSVTGSAEIGAGATSGQIFVIGLVAGFAWGLIEGVMQIIQGRVDRVYSARIIARAAESPELAEPDLTNALNNSLVQHLAADDLARVRAAVIDAAPRAPAPDLRVRPRDLKGGAETFLTLWSATIPPLLPFLLIADAGVALVYSQVIAVGALFVVGALWGRYSEQHPLRTGALMALIGLGMAALLQALGA